MNKKPTVTALVHGARVPVAGLALAVLAGCFSGSGSSSGDGVLQGTFVDSPVTGLTYSLGNEQRRTDEDGRFSYHDGDQLSFSVGGLVLGSATGADLLTPVDLVPDGSLQSPAVLNISRLLQSLDQDGNLLNGIQISAEIDQALADYLAANALNEVDFADTATFDDVMGAMLAELNQQNLFAENADSRQRALRSRLQAWQHLHDSLARHEGVDLNTDRLPVLFIHGGAGSASQFESQAQRFRVNGYPASHVAVFEYDSSALSAALGAQPPNTGPLLALLPQVNEVIDQVLLSTGAEKVNLLGHSMGTLVSQAFLTNPAHSAKVAHYVSLDGRGADALPGNVPTLAIWGEYVERTVVGGENLYPSPEDPVGHIEAATAADSFAAIYRFFNDEAPATQRIPEAGSDHVWLAGKASLFPQNTGASGVQLEIYDLDPVSGARLSDTPLYQQEIGDSGEWGPLQVQKGASVEYALLHGSNQDQYFYREPYNQDSLLVRLNTSRPDEGVGRLFARSANHTNLMIGRDMEFWGDQGDNNDSLTINNREVISDFLAPLSHRLSVLFIHDRDSDRQSNLTRPDPVFSALPFMSGMDMYLPASATGSGTIEVRLKSRHGGADQVLNVPDWPSDKVRSVSIQFRDYSE